ncbi:hypothetical protein AYI69_g8062 [Smittium culicis]|uniref:Rad60/SUMO-like domain-containing protein n=1 Tax=Smittium culicis TaxID=133412 RepID=A0A1R1XMG6_9FUNG|nr:hypothetical protein AYI69_g8062 [Smittium culicis]
MNPIQIILDSDDSDYIKETTSTIKNSFIIDSDDSPPISPIKSSIKAKSSILIPINKTPETKKYPLENLSPLNPTLDKNSQNIYQAPMEHHSTTNNAISEIESSNCENDKKCPIAQSTIFDYKKTPASVNNPSPGVAMYNDSNSSSPIPELNTQTFIPTMYTKKHNISLSENQPLSKKFYSSYENDSDPGTDSSDDAFFSRGISKEQKSKILKNFSENQNINSIDQDFSEEKMSENIPQNIFTLQQTSFPLGTMLNTPSSLNDQSSFINILPKPLNNHSINSSENIPISEKNYDFSSDTSIESIDINVDSIKSSSRKAVLNRNKTAKNRPKANRENVELEVESMYSDLDSSLLQVLNSVNSKPLENNASDIKTPKNGKKGGKGNTKKSNVNVSLSLKLDDTFINKEMKNINPFLWNSKNLSNCEVSSKSEFKLSFKINNDDMFATSLEKLSKDKKIPSDLSKFTLVFEGVKVYPTVTPKAISSLNKISIGEHYIICLHFFFFALFIISTLIPVDYYPNLVYSRFVQQQKEDSEIPSISLISSLDTAAINAVIQNASESLQENNIKIKIRDKSGNDQFLDVGKNVLISDIIIQYKKMRGISDLVTVKFNFDDENLDPDVPIKDTEVEDEDMITAIYQ